MKIIDIVDPQRVNQKPDKTIVLMSSGDFSEHGFIVKKIELKLYLEKKVKLGSMEWQLGNVIEFHLMTHSTFP